MLIPGNLGCVLWSGHCEHFLFYVPTIPASFSAWRVSHIAKGRIWIQAHLATKLVFKPHPLLCVRRKEWKLNFYLVKKASCPPISNIPVFYGIRTTNAASHPTPNRQPLHPTKNYHLGQNIKNANIENMALIGTNFQLLAEHSIA
jgi:hypothetical protein